MQGRNKFGIFKKCFIRFNKHVHCLTLSWKSIASEHCIIPASARVDWQSDYLRRMAVCMWLTRMCNNFRKFVNIYIYIRWTKVIFVIWSLFDTLDIVGRGIMCEHPDTNIALALLCGALLCCAVFWWKVLSD